jgi:hypothetical protein
MAQILCLAPSLARVVVAARQTQQIMAQMVALEAEVHQKVLEEAEALAIPHPHLQAKETMAGLLLIKALITVLEEVAGHLLRGLLEHQPLEEMVEREMRLLCLVHL